MASRFGTFHYTRTAALLMLSLAQCLQADNSAIVPTSAGAIAVQGGLFHDSTWEAGSGVEMPRAQTPALALTGVTLATMGWCCFRRRKLGEEVSPLVRFTLSVGTLRISIDCL